MSSKGAINRRGKLCSSYTFYHDIFSKSIFICWYINTNIALYLTLYLDYLAVLAIQAKKKRKAPKGGRKGRGENDTNAGNSGGGNNNTNTRSNGTPVSARDARNTQTR